MFCFVNFSNHPHEKWGKEQLSAAKEYGEVVSIPFPAVSPSASEQDIESLAREKVREILDKEPAAVLCQGEFTLVFRVVSLLKQHGIKVVAACTERVATELEDGTKMSKFSFVQFREY